YAVAVAIVAVIREKVAKEAAKSTAIAVVIELVLIVELIDLFVTRRQVAISPTGWLWRRRDIHIFRRGLASGLSSPIAPVTCSFHGSISTRARYWRSSNGRSGFGRRRFTL